MNPVRDFTMLETGWRPEAEAADFAVRGAALQAELRSYGPGANIADLAQGAEEVGAVLDGEFLLRCESETYRLVAGQAILIPPAAPRAWSLMSARGTLYRVWCQAGTPA